MEGVVVSIKKRQQPCQWEHTETVVVDGIEYKRSESSYSPTGDDVECQAAAKERAHRCNFFSTSGDSVSDILCGKCLSDTFHVKVREEYYPVCSKCGFCAGQ